MTLSLVDKAKISSRAGETKILVQRRKASVRTRLGLGFLKTFLLKNEGFGILNNEKNVFNDFF